jgi:hypothetical protein
MRFRDEDKICGKLTKMPRKEESRKAKTNASGADANAPTNLVRFLVEDKPDESLHTVFRAVN